MKDAALPISRLRTFTGVALAATFPLSLTLLFGAQLGALVATSAAVVTAALLALALREREGRAISLLMAAMTLPLIGSVLTDFATFPDGSSPLLISVLLLFIGLAAYIVRSAYGPFGLRRFVALGLVVSAGAVANGFGFGGFVVLLILSPVLIITVLLLFAWALSPLRQQSDALRVETSVERETTIGDQKRGRAVVAVSAIAASFSLACSLAAGLSFQGLLDDYPEMPMRSFADLTASLRDGTELRIGDGDDALVLLRPIALEELLLIEADEPCISSGRCNILGVVGVHPNDPSIPIPFLISANQEDVVVEKLTEASTAYFAMDQDPELGYQVRETIKTLTADGNYPIVFPTPIRVEGREAEALVRQAHELLASTAYRPDFEPVVFFPFLFIALIPFGALRWARAAYLGRRSLALLPGMAISTRSYGVTSGIALLLGAAVSGWIASSADGVIWTGLAGSSLIAAAGALLATLRSSRS